MSEREKKLITLFGVALFIIANFFGVKLYLDAKEKAGQDLRRAADAVKQADLYAASYENVVEEMEWLQKYYPEPKAGQTVGTQLEQEAANQALTYQLSIKRRKILPSDEASDAHFNRAKVEFMVNGREENLYKWLDRIQSPEKLRAVTRLILSPQRDDDTNIDCTVQIDQWYVPATGDIVNPPASNDVTAPAPEGVPPVPEGETPPAPDAVVPPPPTEGQLPPGGEPSNPAGS